MPRPFRPHLSPRERRSEDVRVQFDGFRHDETGVPLAHLEKHRQHDVHDGPLGAHGATRSTRVGNRHVRHRHSRSHQIQTIRHENLQKGV